MAATVEIDEQNGPVDAPVLTHDIASSNMGSADAANLDPIACPVAPGNNTCEKWQLLHVTNMGTSSRISGIRVWRTGALGEEAIHMTNARTSGYAGALSYTTPSTATSIVATQIMPSDVPSSANLGIAGSLSGNIVSNGYSDFLVHQIQTNPTALSGSTSSLNYQYDEVA